jgi:hypothetical protein
MIILFRIIRGNGRNMKGMNKGRLSKRTKFNWTSNEEMRGKYKTVTGHLA